ncbi:MAG TPA: phosphotransferase [Dehalococcoidia bacterium]|nr:phosphotransferase [Dehalococcoidia bacterium]
MAGAASREGLQRLVQELSPGGRLVRVRRLRGGLGARMHVLNLETASGRRERLVLRRYIAGWRFSDAAAANKEFRVLQLAASAHIPAPKPVWLDAEARFFTTPCMVLSYLPGRSFHVPRNIHEWVSELARGLTAVHAVAPDRYDLSWLEPLDRQTILHGLEKRRVQATAGPLALQVIDEADRRLQNLDLSNVLIHADFHPGNTVFARTRLSGIVDWPEACLGDPAYDVAQCRLDLVISHGTEVADAFRDAYEKTSGNKLGNLDFFDLERGLLALVHYRRWLDGYHDAGLTHITAQAAGARLRLFLRSALARSHRQS